MKPVDLAFSQLLGIRAAPPGSSHLLELPFAPPLHNHLGTFHAAGQFALAESASAECLRRHFGERAGPVRAVVRRVEGKYRRPATGDLLAFGTPDEKTRDHLLDELASGRPARAVILIDLKDWGGTLAFHGKFEWIIERI